MTFDLDTALWWLFLNLLSTVVLAFYSMQEMACVSFNRIRLHYYVSKGIKRAIWLNYLLQNPARLFGTTLLSVNLAMFIGSECARQSYLALGLNPDLAPLTQVAFVIIFAELAPMFAARRYPERIAMAGAPILYATAKLMAPLLWSLNLVSKIADFLTGKKQTHAPVLNQEDLQRLLATQDEEAANTDEVASEDANAVARNIFGLRTKDAQQVMQTIGSIPALPSNATVGQMKEFIRQTSADYIPIYQNDILHIVGIAYPRDLIRIPDARRIRDHAESPWFVTQSTNVMELLKDFRRNRKSVAIVLNDRGLAIGLITLDDITEEIFGKTEEPEAALPLIIDRTFPGDMLVAEFNEQFEVHLDADENLTLAELMTQLLGHQPELDESVYVSPFELTVKETSLMEIKRITISTRI